MRVERRKDLKKDEEDEEMRYLEEKGKGDEKEEQKGDEKEE